MTLQECRIKIEEIDRDLIPLLNQRLLMAEEVAKAKVTSKEEAGKAGTKKPEPQEIEIYVSEREEELISRCRKSLGDSPVKAAVEEIYTALISSGKRIQRSLLSPGKKCIFLDLDGTLLNDEKQVCARNKNAIEQCLAQGHKIIIASGRPLESAIVGAKKMDLARPGCYIAAYNGGVLYDCGKECNIFDKALGLEETRYLFDEARKFGLHIQAYCEGKVWCETENEEVIFYSRKGQLPYEIHKDVPGELTLPTHKVLLISFEEEKLRDFQKLHVSWEFGRVQSVFSSREFLEYSPLGVSKGNAIERFAGLLGFDLADTIAIGDEQNDISMIMKAGLGVCMANGLESIKQIADYVTTADNNEGGVAEVLERFVLGGF